jgi:hypothetical protein
MVRPARFHQRFQCDILVDVYSPAHRTKYAEGRIVDIGVGGVGVDLLYVLAKNAPYEFRFKFEERDLRLTGRVAWEGPRDPKKKKAHRYGIAMNMSVDQEAQVRIIIDRIRHKQMPSEEGRLRNYWSA